MDLNIHYRPEPLIFSSKFLYQSTSSNLSLLKPLPPYLKQKSNHLSRKKLILRASSSDTTGDENESDSFSWSRVSRSIRRGSERFFSNFGESVKKEIGLDFDEARNKVVLVVAPVRDVAKKCHVAFDRFRFEFVPGFVDWNKLERWKVLPLIPLLPNSCLSY